MRLLGGVPPTTIATPYMCGSSYGLTIACQDQSHSQYQAQRGRALQVPGDRYSVPDKRPKTFDEWKPSAEQPRDQVSNKREWCDNDSYPQDYEDDKGL